MKKIVAVMSFIAISVPSILAPISAFANDLGPARIKPADKVVNHKPGVVHKKYRYLDMVERKRSSLLRNAVIVYDFNVRRARCDTSNAKSVSECLRAPST